jgi:hypothetical protein
MIDISFMKKNLVEKKFKNVRVTTKGMIEFEVNVSNFNFELSKNILKIKNEEKEIIKIKFDEVRDVEFKNNEIIVVYFNFNEKIEIK